MPSTAEQQLLEADVSGELRRLEVNLTAPQKQILLSFLTANPTCTVQAALRFCYARKFDLKRIQTLFNNYVSAVEKNGLNWVTINDVVEELRTLKLYCPGSRDKEGAGLFVICARNHKSKQFPMDSTLKLAFYLAELVTSHPKTQRNGLTLICDLDGVEWSQFDSAFIQKMISFFQNNVPCSIKHILLYKPPWWVNMLVKMVTPFLKEKMRQRIKICRSDSDLKEVIDPSQLPEHLGGKLQYNHDYFIRNELSKVKKIFAYKTLPTKKEREGVDTALVEPPREASYLVENKTVRDVLESERDRKMRAFEEMFREENLRSRSYDITGVLNVLRDCEARKNINVCRVMYWLEHPYPDERLARKSTKREIEPRESVADTSAEQAVQEELPMPATDGDDASRKYSRRVSQGLQTAQSVDFDAEAIKLDKQRRASKPVNL